MRAGLATPRDGELTQECGAGLLELRIEGPKIYVRSPQPKVTPLDNVASAFGIPLAPSEVVHSLSAVMSGLRAASAVASLISPTSHVGPTSTFSKRAGGASGMPNALATLSSGVTFGCGERT